LKQRRPFDRQIDLCGGQGSIGRRRPSDLAADRLLVSYWGPAYQSFLEEIKARRSDGGQQWMEISPVELTVKGY
jgi:hypothetical protein